MSTMKDGKGNRTEHQRAAVPQNCAHCCHHDIRPCFEGESSGILQEVVQPGEAGETPAASFLPCKHVWG